MSKSEIVLLVPMTLKEYFLIGAVTFASSFLAIFSFSLISFFHKRKIARKIIDDLKSEIETEMTFRNIVKNNFKSEGVDDE
jgi:hypothetical protein